MNQLAAFYSARTHCSAGHPYDRPGGPGIKRTCQACIQARIRRVTEARRADQPRRQTERYINQLLARVRPSSFFSCWRWTHKVRSDGYGLIAAGGNHRTQAVHRFAYELAIGPIPEGLEIDHLCNVRNCCNPLHLEAVTRAENRRRQSERQTHCKRGHEFTAANTYRWRNARHCRACRHERDMRYRGGHR